MKLKAGDLIIAGLVLALALFIALSFTEGRADSLTAVVLQNGGVVRRITLSELNQTIEFNLGGEHDNRIRAERGKIRFIESSCPDLICVQTGWLTKPGQVAACLPNGTLIKLEGSAKDNNEVDIYLR